jgi:hypothetical protein
MAPPPLQITPTKKPARRRARNHHKIRGDNNPSS